MNFVQNVISGLNDEICALSVENIVKKHRDVSDREKNFLFNYIREGNLPASERLVSNDATQNIKITMESLSDYKANVISIVDSLFAYGFIPTLLEAQAAK